MDVDKTVVGAWTTALDMDYFTLNQINVPWGAYGLAAKDIRLDTNFDVNGAGAWNGTGDIVGLRTNDPGRGFVIPEPGSLALFGLSVFGLAFSRRRKAG